MTSQASPAQENASGTAALPDRSVASLLPLPAVAVVLTLAAGWWFFSRTPLDLPQRLPGADRPAGTVAAVQVDLAGTFTAGTGVPAAEATGEWPGFRGSGRDNIAGNASVDPRFPSAGPRRLWSVPVGYGYAAPAVAGGRVYLLDYDQVRQADALRCLSLADGAEIWRRSYPVRVKFNHGMSRTVPTVDDGAVVSLGPKGHVLCVDAVSGDFRWGIDLVREYGAKEPPWYAGQCPLIDGGRAILAPAGPQALLVAIDLASGKPVWTTPNAPGWTMTHSSVAPATLCGRAQYVYCGSGGIAGIDAADGRLLWHSSAWKVNIANVPTPVPCGGDRLLVSGGYNAGAAMLHLRQDGTDGAMRVEEVWRLPAREFGSDQQTPIVYQERIYGVIPDGQLVCLDLAGRRQWASGMANRFGLGPFLIAGGALWLLDDNGFLSTAAVPADRFERLAGARVLGGHDAWGPLAVAGNRLLARDLDTLVCLEVGP